MSKEIVIEKDGIFYIAEIIYVFNYNNENYIVYKLEDDYLAASYMLDGDNIVLGEIKDENIYSKINFFLGEKYNE